MIPTDQYGRYKPMLNCGVYTQRIERSGISTTFSSGRRHESCGKVTRHTGVAVNVGYPKVFRCDECNTERQWGA